MEDYDYEVAIVEDEDDGMSMNDYRDYLRVEEDEELMEMQLALELEMASMQEAERGDENELY